MKTLKVFCIKQEHTEVGRIVDHWVLSDDGTVLGFLFGSGLHVLNGTHVGWMEDETLISSDGEIVATLQALPSYTGPVRFARHSERPRVPILGPRSVRPACRQKSAMALQQLFARPPAAETFICSTAMCAQ